MVARNRAVGRAALPRAVAKDDCDRARERNVSRVWRQGVDLVVERGVGQSGQCLNTLVPVSPPNLGIGNSRVNAI